MKLILTIEADTLDDVSNKLVTLAKDIKQMSLVNVFKAEGFLKGKENEVCDWELEVRKQ